MASPRPDRILVPSSGAGWFGRAGKQLRLLKIPWIPVGVLTLLVICAIFAPLIAPFDPREPDLWKGVQRLGPLDSSEHLLGVDVLGRDILSRIVYGARISVFISMASLLFGAAVGTSLGFMAGSLGGKVY